MKKPPFVEGSDRSPLGRRALGKEFVDIYPRKIEHDLDGLLFIRQLVPIERSCSAQQARSARSSCR